MTLKSMFEKVINYDLTSEKSLLMFGFIAVVIILKLIKNKYNSKIGITPLLAGGTVVLNAISFGFFRDFAKFSLINCFVNCTISISGDSQYRNSHSISCPTNFSIRSCIFVFEPVPALGLIIKRMCFILIRNIRANLSRIYIMQFKLNLNIY